MHKFITVLLLSAFFGINAQAQGLFGMRQRPANHFEGTQWYVGMTTGMNFARPTVLERYSEFSLIGAEATTDKEYGEAGLRAGYSAGVTSVMAFTPYIQISLSAQYTNTKFAYQQSYTWEDDENEVNRLVIEDEHVQSLGYLEFPLRVRYAFPINRLKPFVQGGIVYGRLVEARKEITSGSLDYASGGGVQASTVRQTSDITDAFIKSYVGYTLGGGLMYNFGGLMLVVDVNYQQGLHNITDTQARYTSTRHVAGLGQVPDDVKLNTLSYSVSFLFPMKFLTDKTFKPVTF